MLDLAATHESITERDKAQFILEDLARTYQDDDKIGETIDKLSDEAASQNGKEKAIVLNHQGKALFANKDYQQAIRLFSQAILPQQCWPQPQLNACTGSQNIS